MEKYKEVLQWACMHGAEICHVDVADVPGAGRGLLLTEDVAEGQLLLRIPRHLMIAEQRLQQELAPFIAAAPDLAEDDSLLMSTYLLVAAQQCGFHPFEGGADPPQAAGSEHSWGVYLQSLPPLDELLGLPYLWNDDDLTAVGLPAWTAEVVGTREQLLGRDMQLLQTAIRGAHTHSSTYRCPFEQGPRLDPCMFAQLRVPSLREYLWARACVSSRSFLDGGFMDEDFLFAEAAHMLPTAMIPAADMLNHCCDGATCTALWLPAAPETCSNEAEPGAEDAVDTSTRAAPSDETLVDYVLRSPCDMPAGTEVVISYGEKGGEDMLESHGFVPLSAQSARCGTLNPYQAVYLSLAPALSVDSLGDGEHGDGIALADGAKRKSTLEYFTPMDAPVEVAGTFSSITSAIGMFRLALSPPSALQGGAHPDAALHEVSCSRHEAAVLRFMARCVLLHAGIAPHEWSPAVLTAASEHSIEVPAEAAAGTAAAPHAGSAGSAGASSSNSSKAATTQPQAALLDGLPDASCTAQALTAELKRQRVAIAQHLLGFLLCTAQACGALSLGTDVPQALAPLKSWLRCASAAPAERGSTAVSPLAALALPMWHAGDVQSLGEGYLGKILQAAP